MLLAFVYAASYVDVFAKVFCSIVFAFFAYDEGVYVACSLFVSCFRVVVFGGVDYDALFGGLAVTYVRVFIAYFLGVQP